MSKDDGEVFALELSRFIPPEARLMVCQFRGDPNDVAKQNWAAQPYRAFRIDDEANVYFCVSAMKRNEKGEFRRRIAENFSGGLCLMIDDLGDGVGAKFPMSTIDKLRPTAIIETSPNNFQAVYMFDSYVTDAALFNVLINGFIAKQFLSKDTGMAGLNRVFRPPVGVNGKPKYYDERGRPWKVRLAAADYSKRYSIQRIASAFEIPLVRLVSTKSHRIAHSSEIEQRIKSFADVEQILSRAGMLKPDTKYDQGGWREVRCPWIENHTGMADNGAAIAKPSPVTGHNESTGKPIGNDWYGAFRCYHGHCQGKSWRDLAEWVNDQIADDLNNAAAAVDDSWFSGGQS